MSGRFPTTPSWSPGDNIMSTTLIAPVFAAIGVGQFDRSSWATIVSLLNAREATTIGELKQWTKEEFLALLRAASGLQKSPSVYIACVATALQHTFASRTAGTSAPRRGGSSAMGQCTKEFSANFGPNSWIVDGRVYDAIPRKGDQPYLSHKDEELFLDLIVLAAHASSEPIGDYIPDGMAVALGRLHDQIAPPFKRRKNGEERTSAKVINVRFQNGRRTTYKRIVLCEDHACYIGEKTRPFIHFVPAGSAELINNKRANIFAELVAVTRGEAEVCRYPKLALLPYT